MQPKLESLVREIDRCNQRGGRMLSMVDLIEMETIPLDLAAILAARVFSGASFLVGALPGGAGKTAVMGALLACVPPASVLIPTDDPLELVRPPVHDPDAPRCYVCHEIGAGFYYAYLWGNTARAFFELPAAGHQIATNLHADTYEQCRAQLCDENGVSAPSFNSVRLMVFLRVDSAGNRIRRTVETVWESDGVSPHHLLYSADGTVPPIELKTDEEKTAKQALEDCCVNRLNRIETFRQGWIDSFY